MAIPVASALQALLAPGARQRNDRSTFVEHNVRHFSDNLPAGLSLQWLGTAGFCLSYAGTTLLIDPYLTRSGLVRTFGAQLLRPDSGVIAEHVASADAVLVGHTHFDHVLDVPAIAAAHGATVYGSGSLARLMGLYGQAERAVEVAPMRVYAIGPFEVTFVESLHSKLALGVKVAFDGELTCDHLDGLRGSAYRCGQVYGIHIAVAGVRFYHQGSANLVDERIAHRGVDYFLAGISGRGYTPNYVRRILSRLQPRVIIPHHFDDFFRPLAQDMGFSLNVNLGGFVEEVHRVSSDFSVRTLSPLQTWARATPRDPRDPTRPKA